MQIEPTPRSESGLTQAREGRLMSRAIREGWLSPECWPTHLSKSELAEAVKQSGQLSLIAKATLATHSLVENDDPRVKGIGAKLVLQMQAQNLAAEPQQSSVTHTHEIGPQTALTLEQRKANAIERATRLGISFGGRAGGD